MPEASPRVLLLPSSWPSAASPVAGIFVRDQATALRDAGLRVGAVYPDRRSLRTFSPIALGRQHGQVVMGDEAGIETIRWQGWNIPRRGPSGRLFRAVAARLVRRYVAEHGRPDLIHAHGSIWAGAAAAEVAVRMDLPYVVTEHASSFLIGQLRGSEAAAARLAFARSRSVIAVSRPLAASLEPFVPDATAIRVVGNIVDTDFFTPGGRRRAPDAPLRLFCLAQLQPAKGVDVLLRAFALAIRRRPTMTLEVGGGNRGWGVLRRLAARLDIERQVAFVGPLSREQVRSSLWRADALVSPSRVETFGVVIAEALATGLPVIATRSGGPEDIVLPMLGQLVPAEDEASLADAIVGFDPTSEHAPELARIRRASIVERFSPAVIAARLLEVYADVLGGQR